MNKILELEKESAKMKLSLDQIIPDPNQPRKTFKEETLQELKDSYKALGLIQPITVRPINGKFMIVTGERRYKAALLNKEKEIECIVREDITEKMAREMQFTENMTHEDTPPLELGEAFYNYRKKYSVTQEKLAQLVGMTRQTIARYEDLYKMPAAGKFYVKSGQLDHTIASELTTIKDEDRQCEFAKVIVDKGLGRSAVRKLKPLVESQPHRSVESIYASQVAMNAPKEQSPDPIVTEIIKRVEYPVKLIEFKLDCEQWILAASNLDLALLDMLNRNQKEDLLLVIERNEQATQRIKNYLCSNKMIEG